MVQTPCLFRKTVNRSLIASEEHKKFVTSLPGNMGREIVGDIEVDS